MKGKHKKQMYIAGHAAEKIKYSGTEELTCYWWVLKHLQYKMFSDSVIPELVLETFSPYISVLSVTHH